MANAEHGSSAESGTTIHGCVILTKLGKCLAQCTHGGRASDVQTATLCQLVATMQDVGGSLQFGYLELHGLGVVLQQGYHVTIAVLCDPEHGQASARLVAMQALNVFGSNERGTQTRTPPQKPRVPTLRPPCRATTELFHGEIDALAEAHERDMSAVVSSYTFHSATQSPAGEALETLPAFRGFERAYLQPLLQRPPSAALWLGPLLEPACALVAWLVNPSPLRSQPPILLGPDRRPGRALAAYAGPHVAAVWWPALEQARALLQARATATGKQNKKARLAAVAFPSAAQGGGCLHVAVHAVRLMPGGHHAAPRDAAMRRAPRRATPRHAPRRATARAAPLPSSAALAPSRHRRVRPTRPIPYPTRTRAGAACLLLFYELPLRLSGTNTPATAEDGGAPASADDCGAVQLPEASIPQAADGPRTTARRFPGARAPFSACVCAGHSDRAAWLGAPHPRGLPARRQRGPPARAQRACRVRRRHTPHPAHAEARQRQRRSRTE